MKNKEPAIFFVKILTITEIIGNAADAVNLLNGHNEDMAINLGRNRLACQPGPFFSGKGKLTVFCQLNVSMEFI